MNPEELKKKVVIPNERGVLDKKGIYFSSPSAFAREHLFFVLLGAEFTCTFPYQIRRQGLELFLAFRILSGEVEKLEADRIFGIVVVRFLAVQEYDIALPGAKA